MAALPKLFRLCRPVLCMNTAAIRLQRPSISTVITCSKNDKRVSLHPMQLSVQGHQVNQVRCAGDGPPPGTDRLTMEKRLILILQLYDKVDPEKVTLESRFKEDLNLDSLDHVEVIMAVEDEFGFEIPDGDAEHLHTPGLVVQYICDKFDILD